MSEDNKNLLIEQARSEYYSKGIRIIPDSEFDILSGNKSRIIGFPEEYRYTIKHEEPMLSLRNTYEIAEVISFFRKREEEIKRKGGDYTDIEYIMSPKVDGIAISIQYDESKNLEHVSTRGDGNLGRDITILARSFANIKERIENIHLRNMQNTKVEFRGEAFITYQNLQRLNEKHSCEGLSTYITPLQAVTSILNKKNPTKEELSKIYVIVHSSPLLSKFFWTDAERFYLPVVDNRTEKLEDVGLWLQVWEKMFKANSNIPVDGIVVSIKDRKLCRLLGATKTEPRWSIAYKFKF